MERGMRRVDEEAAAAEWPAAKGGVELLNKVEMQVNEETESNISYSVDEENRESTLTSRVVSLLFGDLLGPFPAFERWLASTRRRRSQLKSSGFPCRSSKTSDIMSVGLPSINNFSLSLLFPSEVPTEPSNTHECDQPSEVCLWERLGSAVTLNIESTSFPWDKLSSLHRTEHNSSAEHSEDETSKVLEVTVNSGGVVFFALFSNVAHDELSLNESAAVVKFSSSKVATQAERLGYEFARLFGVQTPQCRMIHSCSLEWEQIKDATENAQKMASSFGDESGEMTCSELLEALELSRCLLLMSYVHGSPLLECTKAFETVEAAQSTAASLGRVLMLDLVLRNEDRLPCRQLGWRGNLGNLMISDSFLSTSDDNIHKASPCSKFHIVAIDSGVPRWPPAGKRAKDRVQYPQLVELILNSPDYSSSILYEISRGKLGLNKIEESTELEHSGTIFSDGDMASIVDEFRSGFLAALKELQGFHHFLIQLYQKLDNLVQVLSSIMTKITGESDQSDYEHVDSSLPIPSVTTPCSVAKHVINEESTPKSASSTGSRGSSPSEFVSPASRDSWGTRCYKGSGESSQNLKLATKLRCKISKLDPELHSEIQQWTENLRADVVKFCQDNNFHSGFLDGNESSMAFNAIELKLRLEHVLERISLIIDAACTECPSSVTGHVFIGGALAARSLHTLQFLGITHVLCLCANETGQSDSQYPNNFEYMNFSIRDEDDASIADLFQDASDFIDRVEQSGGRVLVHCFEGKSRSSTVVLAYLMLRKNFTLVEAWNTLKKAHCRAQPNDGFAKVLVELDRQLHGKASMEWHKRRPEMKTCGICGKHVGLSTSSLKLHMQRAHKRLSTGSVDSAMTVEIQKALTDLQISRTGSLSPTKFMLAAIPD